MQSILPLKHKLEKFLKNHSPHEELVLHPPPPPPPPKKKNLEATSKLLATWNKVSNVGPQISGATERNLVAWETRRPHPCTPTFVLRSAVQDISWHLLTALRHQWLTVKLQNKSTPVVKTIWQSHDESQSILSTGNVPTHCTGFSRSRSVTN